MILISDLLVQPSRYLLALYPTVSWRPFHIGFFYGSNKNRTTPRSVFYTDWSKSIRCEGMGRSREWVASIRGRSFRFSATNGSGASCFTTGISIKLPVVYCESVNLIGYITAFYLLIENSYTSMHIAHVWHNRSIDNSYRSNSFEFQRTKTVRVLPGWKSTTEMAIWRILCGSLQTFSRWTTVARVERLES